MLFGPLSAVHHTAEPEVIRAGAAFAFAARAHDITRAILIGAQERSAAMHFLGFVGFRWIIGSFRPMRVSRDAPDGSELLVVVGPIPVAGPLPDVCCHVIQAIRIRGVLSDRGKAREGILRHVGALKARL